MLSLVNRFINQVLYKAGSKQIGEVSKEFIKNFLSENPIIVKAGASDELDTVEMNKVWTKGQMYAFEPIPYLFDKLVTRIKGLKNVSGFRVEREELALGDGVNVSFVRQKAGAISV